MKDKIPNQAVFEAYFSVPKRIIYTVYLESSPYARKGAGAG